MIEVAVCVKRSRFLPKQFCITVVQSTNVLLHLAFLKRCTGSSLFISGSSACWTRNQRLSVVRASAPRRDTRVATNATRVECHSKLSGTKGRRILTFRSQLIKTCLLQYPSSRRASTTSVSRDIRAEFSSEKLHASMPKLPRLVRRRLNRPGAGELAKHRVEFKAMNVPAGCAYTSFATS